MMAHQKSAGVNQKILFYLLSKYRGPARFSGMVYLSQLAQAEAMAFATSHWRRNMARCGGALYWQYNDCWPVASWAGIDYARQYKALHYHARHFNKPICLSNDYYRDRAELYLTNDLPEDFNGVLEWKLTDFSGATVNGDACPVSVPGVTARRILTLNYRSVTGGVRRNRLALSLKLRRGNTLGEIVDEKKYLLVPDKAAALPKPHIAVSALIKDHSAYITLHSDVYARRVYLEVEGVAAPFSDNFFDIEGQGSCTVTAPLPAGIDTEDAAAFTRRIRVWSMADLESSGSLTGGAIRRFAMRFQPINLITWFLFKFL
jgi:beta-mannosidase